MGDAFRSFLKLKLNKAEFQLADSHPNTRKKKCRDTTLKSKWLFFNSTSKWRIFTLGYIVTNSDMFSIWVANTVYLKKDKRIWLRGERSLDQLQQYVPLMVGENYQFSYSKRFNTKSLGKEIYFPLNY